MMDIVEFLVNFSYLRIQSKTGAFSSASAPASGRLQRALTTQGSEVSLAVPIERHLEHQGLAGGRVECEVSCGVPGALTREKNGECRATIMVPFLLVMALGEMVVNPA